MHSCEARHLCKSRSMRFKKNKYAMYIYSQSLRMLECCNPHDFQTSSQKTHIHNKVYENKNETAIYFVLFHFFLVWIADSFDK